MKREDMINMEYAITSLKLKHPSLCVIDMLINLYDVQFLGCRNCIFRDTSIDDDERIRRIVSRDDSQKPEEIKRRTNADRKTFNNFEFDFTVANYDLDKCLHETAKIITQRMEK